MVVDTVLSKGTHPSSAVFDTNLAHFGAGPATLSLPPPMTSFNGNSGVKFCVTIAASVILCENIDENLTKFCQTLASCGTKSSEGKESVLDSEIC